MSLTCTSCDCIGGDQKHQVLAHKPDTRCTTADFLFRLLALQGCVSCHTLCRACVPKPDTFECLLCSHLRCNSGSQTHMLLAIIILLRWQPATQCTHCLTVSSMYSYGVQPSSWGEVLVPLHLSGGGAPVQLGIPCPLHLGVLVPLYLLVRPIERYRGSSMPRCRGHDTPSCRGSSTPSCRYIRGCQAATFATAPLVLSS